VGKANVVRDNLLKALIGSASESVVKDVFTVNLQQLEAGQIGQASDEEKARRVAVVRNILGDRAAQRLEAM
jgi:DNA-binding TFAR19-related protein (PDSD5 family)